MHFDAAFVRIPERVMMESAFIEVGAEFAIDAREEIQVELCRDTGAIVIGRAQHVLILDEIGAKQECRVRAQQCARFAQKFQAALRTEIADRGSREETDLVSPADFRRQLQCIGEVADDR
jgi:hypothetical protein